MGGTPLWAGEVSERVLKHLVFKAGDAAKVVKLFKGLAKKHIEKAEGEIRSSSRMGLLEDAIDAYGDVYDRRGIDRVEPSSASKVKVKAKSEDRKVKIEIKDEEPHAFVALESLMALVKAHTLRFNDDLEIVDIFEDDRVWAVPDGGCNSTCHSPLWRRNAEEMWAKMAAGRKSHCRHHNKQN